jgi:site-specific DNA-cytosine methylase
MSPRLAYDPYDDDDYDPMDSGVTHVTPAKPACDPYADYDPRLEAEYAAELRQGPHRRRHRTRLRALRVQRVPRLSRRLLLGDRHSVLEVRMTIRAIDLCCGAGGWICAAQGLPIEFVAAVDWAEDCCFTVRYNYPQVPVVCGDATALPLDLAGVDLVLGAVPCEQLSVARCNVPVEEEDMRAMRDLLDGLLALVDRLHPRWWAIENVVQVRRQLPPLTPYVMLNARDWSGQARRRCLIGQFPLPPNGHSQPLRKYLRPGPYTITRKEALSATVSRKQFYGENEIRLLDPAEACPTVTDIGAGHRNRAFIVQKAGRRRHLTLQEVARLQGFPADYVFVASPTRAGKMVAQAVQIDMARAILQAIVTEAER